MSKRSFVVSLIGRPNVGKSTLFNRFMRNNHKAITHDLPGVTRDRHYGIAKLRESYDLEEREVILVDTGGFYPEPTNQELVKQDNVNAFFNIMADHGRLAINESDLILLIVDVREGLNPFDKMIVDFIRKEKKDFFLVVNKFDSSKQEGDEAVFYELGIDQEQMYITSAEHGMGLNGLRESMHKWADRFDSKLSDDGKYLQKGVKPRHEVVGNLAIVGSPNAGKSTLLNALVGAERALVSNIAGTTVDPIEAYINLDFEKEVSVLNAKENVFRKLEERLSREYSEFKEKFTEVANEEGDFELVVKEASEVDDKCEEMFSVEEQLEQLEEPMDTEENAIDANIIEEVVLNTWRSLKVIDTAGIRKSRKVDGYLENQSVYSALRSITESDVILFIVDATKGITHQDRRLMDIALEKGKSLIVCLNKIDLMNDIMGDAKKKQEWLTDIRYDVPWLNFCELVPISAKKRSFFQNLRKAITKTLLIRHRKIPTGPLNRHFNYMVDRNPVVLKGSRGQVFKIKYASMLKATPPTFILFCNKSQGIPTNYRRYLQSGLRNEFKLINTPVHLIFRSGADLEKRLKEKGPGKKKFTK